MLSCSIRKRYVHTTCGSLIEYVRFGPGDDPRLWCRMCNMSQPVLVLELTKEMLTVYRLGGREAVKVICDARVGDWQVGSLAK